MSPARQVRPPAVIVGIDGTIGLQCARILHARGVPIIGIATDRHHYCARTRIPQRIVTAPTAGEPLIEALEKLAPQLPEPGFAFLLPGREDPILAMSEYRQRLAPAYRFVLPAHDVLVGLMDKRRFAEHAQAHGLPIPPTAVLRSRDDAERAAAELEFPAVVKPPLKTEAWRDNAPAKAIHVRDGSELLAIYDRTSAWADVLVAQSWIPGGEESLFNCNAYFDRQGQLLVTFVNRKLRQWPLDTGQGTLGVEVRNDAVRDTTVRLFESLGYTGLAHLEMKRDSRSGRHYMIESNAGRPTNRVTIAERGGVEFLMTAYADAVGLPLPSQRTQHYRGAKWIDWRHDLQVSAVRIRRRELTLTDWLRSVRGPWIEAVGSLRDPLPFAADLAEAVGRLARRRLGGARPSRG